MAMHEGLPVEGYVSQPTLNVRLVNSNKRLEERVLRQLDTLAWTEMEGVEIDQEWLRDGRRMIEQGFMAVNRAVFRPQRVSLDEPTEFEPGTDAAAAELPT